MAELNRRSVLAGAVLFAGSWALAPAAEAAGPFGRYGSPARRLNERTLYVDGAGRGDYTTVQAAVDATPDSPEAGWVLVLAEGVYREVVLVNALKVGLTFLGATCRAEDVVIVFDNANGTPKPAGGTYGTSGSATVTLQAAGFTAQNVTFANDWLRADHPEITGTQAVALKVTGDRSAFFECRFLGHQDTLYADSPSIAAFSRQYFRDCYVEGDVDFVFGRGTAVLERCELRTLVRDVTFTPQGFVFAPSTAAANPHGFLAVRSRITSTAPDGAYCLARPWRPSSDLTALPMLVVRNTALSAGINAETPYGTMSSAFPWQDARFDEYRNTGPGAQIIVPENRPQLTDEEAPLHTPKVYLGDWEPVRPRP
jgi:pectinesterase